MNKPSEGSLLVKEALSANQLAAKALHLCVKGKHEEAEKLMQEAETIKVKQDVEENSDRPQIVSSINSPRKKSCRKGRDRDHKVSEKNDLAKRILTQQDRCHSCFENPNQPKHLVVLIANFTYLMLPQRQPVVPGHRCILPMQHDSATRNVDNNVWEEI